MDRIQKLQQFLAEKPDDCFLKHALALEYVKLGQPEKARELFEANLRFNPAYLATYYHLGQLLERSNLPGQALEVYASGMEQARRSGDRHTYNELLQVFTELQDI